NLIRRTDAHPDLSHPYVRRITQRGRLVDGSSRTGHDLHVSEGRRADAALRYPQGRGRRGLFGFGRNIAVPLSCQLWLVSPIARVCALRPRNGFERGRHSVHYLCLRFGRERTPADGDDLTQYSSASRRAHPDDTVRNVSRMETGYGAPGGRHLRSLYRDLHAAQHHSYPAFGSSSKTAFFHREDETV